MHHALLDDALQRVARSWQTGKTADLHQHNPSSHTVFHQRYLLGTGRGPRYSKHEAGAKYELTASIGYSSYCGDIFAFQDALAKADEALYEEKKARTAG